MALALPFMSDRRPAARDHAPPAPRVVRLAHGSFAVQARMRHASLPALAAGCFVAKDEDRSRFERDEMRAIQAGDSAALQRLIDREGPRLLRFARGLLGNLDEAEDVVQDTMIRLWEKAAEWTPDARIGTWLHRVCYNRAIDKLRRRRAVVDESVLEEVADPADAADVALVRAESAQRVAAAVDGLPARQRSAVLLFHMQGLSQREAAAAMGISEAAFESTLARARRKLRRSLAENGRAEEVSDD